VLRPHRNGNYTQCAGCQQIDGATYDVQQIDEETVKIIARRELSKNIDKSVASVMSNPNSRTEKQPVVHIVLKGNSNGNER